MIVSTTAEHNLDVLATLRARAGVAFDRFHVFATGGLAVGHINLQGSIIPNPAANPTYVGSRSLVKAGYAYGGGINMHSPVDSHPGRIPALRSRIVDAAPERDHRAGAGRVRHDALPHQR